MPVRHRLLGVLYALLFAACCGCGTDATVSAETQGTGLVLEPASLELRADDMSDRQQDVTCRLINRGGEEVRITSVDTSCACTLAGPLEKTRLKPGESVPLRLKASLPAYGRKESLVKVSVEPASVASSTLRLILHGPERPVPHVELVPGQLLLSGRRPGEAVLQEFEVTTLERADAEPWIRGITDPTGEVEVVLTAAPSEEPRGELALRTYRFRAEATLPEKTDVARRFTLTVEGDPAATRNGSPLAIHGTRVAVPLVQVVPAQIVLQRSKIADWPVTRRVMIVANDEEGVSLEVPSELPEWINLKPIEGNGSARVRTFEITVADPPTGNLTETLLFGVGAEAFQATAGLAVSLTP